MKTIHAIYEGGVFRPTEPVELPPSCEVEFEPRVVSNGEGERQAMANVRKILGRHYATGDADVAERHDEHQP